VVLAIAIAGFALIVRIVNSPFCQVLNVIQKSKMSCVLFRSATVISRYKLLAFVLFGLMRSNKTLVGRLGIIFGPIIVCVPAFRRGIVGEISELLTKQQVQKSDVSHFIIQSLSAACCYGGWHARVSSLNRRQINA